LGFYIAQEKNFKKSDYNIIRNQMTTTCLIADFKKKNHPFIDGSKRIGLLVMPVF